MAQVINREQVPTADLISSLITDFQSVFNFSSVDTETNTMNITTDLYMKFAIASSTLTITFGNGNGDLYVMNFNNVSATYSHYYQIIKSTSGDVAFRFQPRNPLTDNNYLQFAIVRVTDNNETYSWGIFSPAPYNPNATMPYTQGIIAATSGNMLLLCNDNVRVGVNASQMNSTSAATSYTVTGAGFNPNAVYTFLSNVYNMYTKYTTVNFKAMMMTPQPYNRVCTFGTNKYYCISLYAMLDNDL